MVTANPPLVQWVWDLVCAVVQLVFLAAFCERWLAVEDQVPTGPPPRRQPRPRRGPPTRPPRWPRAPERRPQSSLL